MFSSSPPPTGILGAQPGSCASSQTLDHSEGISSKLYKWVSANQPYGSSGDRDKDPSTRPLYVSLLWHKANVPPMTTKEREGGRGK